VPPQLMGSVCDRWSGATGLRVDPSDRMAATKLINRSVRRIAYRGAGGVKRPGLGTAVRRGRSRSRWWEASEA